MSPLFEDTPAEVETLYVEHLRRIPPWRKLEILTQMNSLAVDLAMSGLRQRHPHASEAELRRRLADLLLEPELAERVRAYPTNMGRNDVSEPKDVLWLVVETLERLGISYLVTGSFASAIHGVVRTTLDADILADVHREHVPRLVQAFEDGFYMSAEAVREAVHRQSSFNIIHLRTMFKVDIFLPKRPFDHAQLSRRVKATISSEPRREIYVATPEDVILSKLDWYRQGGEISERQWRDVQGILRVQRERLDVAYMRRWATTLGIVDLLEKALAEAR